jgi:hypothetical protein
MKVLRILIPMLLLLIAVPSFAVCTFCDINCNCALGMPGDMTHCKPTIDCCKDVAASCLTASEPTPMLFAADYTIASVEVVTPAKHVVRTTEPRLAERTQHPIARTR